MKKKAIIVGVALVAILGTVSTVNIPSSDYAKVEPSRAGLSLGALFKALFKAEALAPKAKAASQGETFRDAVFRNFFLITGYPTRARYLELTGCTNAQVESNTCDAEPEGGMVGIVEDILTSGESALSAAGVASCAAIPADGTAYTGTHEELESLTLTTASPAKVIPTGHRGANGSAKYDKRLNITNASGTRIAWVEFNCSTQQGYFGINFETRYIEFYIDNDTTNGIKAEFFMRFDPSNSERMFVTLTTNPADSTFAYTMVHANSSSAERMAAKGSYSSKKATALFQQVTGASLTAIAADGNATDTAVTHNGSSRYLVCVQKGVDPTLGSGCANLSLTANTGSPAIDSSGALDINWAAKTSNGLASKIWVADTF